MPKCMTARALDFASRILGDRGLGSDVCPRRAGSKNRAGSTHIELARCSELARRNRASSTFRASSTRIELARVSRIELARW